MFVTGYALTDIADEYRCHHGNDDNGTVINMAVESCLCVQTSNKRYSVLPSEQSRKIFIEFGRYAIVFLVVFNLLMEVSYFLFFSFYMTTL